MKKLTLTILLITLLSLCFSACKALSPDAEISQLREDILFGSNAEFDITVYPEEREIPLEFDGKAQEKTKVLIIKISGKSEISGTYSVFVTIDGKEYSAKPEERASNIMRAVIPVEALPDRALTVRLEGEIQAEINCSSIISEAVAPYKTALDKAKAALGEKLIYDGKRIKGEFMLRVLYENNNTFWYVGYVNEENSHSLLISEDGKTVIAERTTKNP